ncbi:hypothetical protein FK531_10245 [Rhodococcus spelaei]|uniref:GTPase n=1 Tax=Rhodococcus spelaei TaxID=2546320 RepID=A0A541B9Y3_9NOCA|nr:hypothetical protein [Rhodococcus spelaei]TQF69140.1 hypothetical protein FK531_10245 [Rhodococcus spelaei]
MPSTGVDRLLQTLGEADPTAAATIARATRLLGAAVRVEVTGRAGVGKSAVAASLGPVPGAAVEQTASWDVPGAADPDLTADVVLLVVLDPPRSADRAALREAGERAVLVLNKVDTLGDPAAAADHCADELGTSCLPTSTVGEGSGIGAVRHAVAARVAAVRADRSAALLAALRSHTGMAAVRDPIEEYLAGDEGVRLAATATGEPVPADESRPQALRRAVDWRDRMAASRDARAMRAALTLQRDAVRSWGRDG